MPTFPCPRGDGDCATHDEPSGLTLALWRGEFVVGGSKLVDAYYREGFDFAGPQGKPLPLPEELTRRLRGDLRGLAGMRLEDLAPGIPELSHASGIIVSCSPCGHRWIDESS